MTETLPDDIRATISAQIPYPQRRWGWPMNMPGWQKILLPTPI